MEAAIAEAWDASGHEAIIPDATDRDKQVAATVVQWLGSNVGQDFLHGLGFKQKEELKCEIDYLSV